jgi:hypothetical protein
MNTDAEKLPFPIVTVAGSQVSNSHQAKDDLQSRTYTADSTESTRQSDFGSDSNPPPGTESPKELSIADRAEMMDIGDGQPFSTAVPEKEPLEHRKDDSQESKNNLG